MTARKRRKKRNGQAESSQVELLPEVVAADPPSGAEEADAPEALDAAATPVDSPGDRWAKAVGRREPLRPLETPKSEVRARSIGVPEPDASEEARATRTVDSHRSARDHAAASVRPAGEPLARAKELVERGRVHEAIELYLGILTVNASNLKAHNNLGVLFDELKQYEPALEHFQAAERLAPENGEVLTNFASTLTSLARYEEAESLLRRAQRLASEDVQVRLGIGILHFRRGLYGLAETELRWVCARDRDNGLAFYYRGEALNRLSRFEEARKALEHSVTLLPHDPRSYYTLGHLYDRKSMPDEAGEMYRRARELQDR